MAFAASLAELQAETSCPICLDYLRDPVTTDCGHNFCRSCIHQCWEDLQDIFPCPVCLHHCPDKTLQRNTQLCHMTDFVKQLPTPRSSKRKRQEEEPLCEKHSQVLALFCEKDLELLCLQCRVSCDHQGHPLIPIEQAAATHRKKLKSYLEPLKKQVEDAKRQCEIPVLKTFDVRWKMDNWSRELQSEFEELKHFLRKEQAAIHNRLCTEEKDVEEKLIENQSQISDHISTLKNLLYEVRDKCFQADLDLLTGIKNIHNMYENLKTPAVLSYELKKENLSLPPHYFGLQKMISTFQVDLTLDPETAHSNLIVSKDGKSVIFRKINPDTLYNPHAFHFYAAVWSREQFDAGRHFWQVEVRGTGTWSLGVCKDSFPRDALTVPSPQKGCWQIQYFSSMFSTRDTVQVIRIGIFLDYDLGEVSFYNLNNRSYLYTFTDKFTEKLVPYFSIGRSSKSLTISIVRDQ